MKKSSLAIILALFSVSGLVLAAQEHATTSGLPPPVATFSILGFDPDTGEVGGAVQSRVFSVGNGVLWADAEAGMAATQAIVDVSYGPKSLALLKARLAKITISLAARGVAASVRSRSASANFAAAWGTSRFCCCANLKQEAASSAPAAAPRRLKLDWAAASILRPFAMAEAACCRSASA